MKIRILTESSQSTFGSTNFYNGTVAVFTPIAKTDTSTPERFSDYYSPSGGEFWYTSKGCIVSHLIGTIGNAKEVTVIYPELKGKPDYCSSSGSQYWYTSSGVYRLSNHWGTGISSCDWFLGKERVSSHSDTEGDRVGFCKWKDFKPVNYDSVPIYQKTNDRRHSVSLLVDGKKVERSFEGKIGDISAKDAVSGRKVMDGIAHSVQLDGDRWILVEL